jgi:8-oxo-dGTP diphosphatase
MKRLINVAGAAIVEDGTVLCVRRGPGGSLPGMWEFPGGKIEPGEAPEAALAREIREELHCAVSVGKPVTTTMHEYDFGVVGLTTFYCSLVEGTPTLTEHTEMRWLAASDLASLDWAPADIPAVALIEEHLLQSSSR